MMLLVKQALKFYRKMLSFLLKKYEELLQCKTAKVPLIFTTKNISVFNYKVIKLLTSSPLFKLVKLTLLRTTGPRLRLLIYLAAKQDLPYPECPQISHKSYEMQLSDWLSPFFKQSKRSRSVL